MAKNGHTTDQIISRDRYTRTQWIFDIGIYNRYYDNEMVNDGV